VFLLLIVAAKNSRKRRDAGSPAVAMIAGMTTRRPELRATAWDGCAIQNTFLAPEFSR
jgi:hypothetical protein